ncbi:HupE/UreJ family protein, partial [Vibrio sp. FNV 38]|nr:HupE/UreJ family protein [Vibrio sp. FNV 38]
MRHKITLTMVLLFCSFSVFSHSLDSMFVSISEFAPNEYRAVVTPSAKADTGNTPRLVFPNFCSDKSMLENFYTLSCEESLKNAEIEVDYFLADLSVNMVISFQDLSGKSTAIEVHQDNRFILSSDASSQQKFSLQTGFEHMLSGIEHVLMVILIVLLYPNLRQLIKVVSIFTISHLVAMW